MKLSANSAQMRILKRVFVLQAIFEDAVSAGVGEEYYAGEVPPGEGQ